MPKGRIMRESAQLLAAAGFDISPVFDDSRRLVYDCGSPAGPGRALVGRADLRRVRRRRRRDRRRDVLDELGPDLYQPVDLGIGACRMIVAEPADRPVDERSQMHIRIASKFPRITRRYLDARGLHAEIIKLSGSIRAGPLTGLCDRIVDITQTGETLRQNGLVEVDTIMDITCRLVANPASLKLRPTALANFIAKLEQQVEGPRATPQL